MKTFEVVRLLRYIGDANNKIGMERILAHLNSSCQYPISHSLLFLFCKERIAYGRFRPELLQLDKSYP